MISILEPVSQNAPRRVSGIVRRKTAHDACARPFCSTARLSLEKAEAVKLGRLEEWKTVVSRKQARMIRIQDSSTQFVSVLDCLCKAAANQYAVKNKGKQPSVRKLAQLIGLPESTLRLLRKIAATNPKSGIRWLPRIKAALSKLNPS